MIAFSIVSGVAAALLAIVGVVLAIQPAERPEHKTACLRTLFGLAIVLLLCAIIQPFVDARDKQETQKKLSEVQGSLEQQGKDFAHAEGQYKEVIHTMANSDQPLKAALDVLSTMPSPEGTNNYFDPKNLADLLQNDEAAANQRHIANFVAIAPIADYAMRVVNQQCLQLAKEYGDELASSYHKLPDKLPPDLKTQVVIQLATNKGFKFDCDINYVMGPDLFIHSFGNDSIQIEKDNNGVRIQCNTDPEISFAGTVPFDQWQDKYKQLFALLLARQLQEHPLVQVKRGN